MSRPGVAARIERALSNLPRSSLILLPSFDGLFSKLHFAKATPHKTKITNELKSNHISTIKQQQQSLPTDHFITSYVSLRKLNEAALALISATCSCCCSCCSCCCCCWLPSASISHTFCLVCMQQ